MQFIDKQPTFLRKVMQNLLAKVKANLEVNNNAPAIDPMEILNAQDMSLAHRQNRQMLAEGGDAEKEEEEEILNFFEWMDKEGREEYQNPSYDPNRSGALSFVDAIQDYRKYKKREEAKKDKRVEKQEGGELDAQMADMMPDDQMIAEAQAEDFAQEGMVPDEEMEEDYVEFIMSEALEPEEQQYLSEKLVEDDQLSMIFDKVVETASEFSGSGPVEGPGTGISDSIPARLSDGEFVMTAKATDAIGADTLNELMTLAEQEADAGRQMKQTGGLITKEEEQEEQTQKIPSVIVEREQPLLVEEEPMQQKNKEAMRSLDPRLSLFAS